MPQVIGAKKAKQLTFDPLLTPEDQAYLRNLPFTLSMPSHGVCVVHAGFLPGVPIQQQPLEGMIEVGPASLPACLGDAGMGVDCAGTAGLLEGSCMHDCRQDLRRM